jgi:drug/metabolite transporter (DMT)-like permease
VSKTGLARQGRGDSGRPDMHRGGIAPVLLILASVLLFPVTDAIAKMLAGTLPVVEVAWGRLVFQSLAIAVLAGTAGVRLRTTRWRLQLSRSLLHVANIALLVGALSLLPLGTAVTILFTFPILITALAVPLLGERVGARSWVAVLLGFAGTMIILRPGFPGSYLGVALAFGAALASAVFQIVTRRLVLTDAPLATLLYSSVGAAMIASLAAVPAWIPPSPSEWAWLALLGVLGGAVNWLVATAFRYVSPAVIAPLSYGEIIGAAALGYLFFGEVPDAYFVIGAALIIVSGAWIAWKGASGRNADGNAPLPTA